MDRRLSPRASVIWFVVTTLVAGSTATGVFVLLDPRAQAFWVARLVDLVQAVRGLFGG